MQNSAIFSILLALLTRCQESARWIHTSLAQLPTASPRLPCEQVFYTCRKPLACSFKDKKENSPEPLQSAYSVIQRKYAFFCPQTSKSVRIITCLLKASLEIPYPSPTQPCPPDQHRSPSDTLAPTAPTSGTGRDAHHRRLGSARREVHIAASRLLGIRDCHAAFCPNTEATNSITSPGF